MGLSRWIFVIGAIAFGSTCIQSSVYELKRNGTACIIVDSTLTVRVLYRNIYNRMVFATWTLDNAGSRGIVGSCASESPNSSLAGDLFRVCQTPNCSWSMLQINASDAVVGFLFVSNGGRVTLAYVSLSVSFTNGTRFVNPALDGPSQETLISLVNLPMSSDVERFICRSRIRLELPAGTPDTGYTEVQLSGLTQLQAFNLTGGRLSSRSAECDQDTSTATPLTTSSPAPEPPLLNLTVFKYPGGPPCLRLQARLQLSVPYLKAGSVGLATVVMHDNAVAGGDCGDDHVPATEQSLRVTFYNNWRLTMRFTRSDSSYALSGLQLNYNVNDAAVFPDATDAGKILTVAESETYIGGVPINGYYACSLVNLTLGEPPLNIALTASQLVMQAFRTDGRVDEFTGERKECPTEVKNIVLIVVGASLAGLAGFVVVVVGACLIIRRRQASRAGYQSI